MEVSKVRSHRQLLEIRKPSFGMTGELYGREDVLETDLEVFFHRHWILAGVDADVPEPGDVSVIDIGKASIIIVRDDDGGVRAFRNLCRHRGARLKEAGKSTVGMLVCPYHQWTYDLEGTLKYAGHMGKGFDKECRNLFPVHIRSVGGLLFVCLSDNPPEDFSRLEEVMLPRLTPFQLDKAKIAYETDVVEEGNWKLVIENNRECYHCSSNHPSLIHSMSAADLGLNSEELSEEQRKEVAEYFEYSRNLYETWEAEGLHCAVVDEMAADRTTAFRAQRLVIAGHGESETLSTKVASKIPLGEVKRLNQGSTHLWTHNSWNHVMSDHAVISFLIPLSPGKTLVRTKWLVHQDAVEGVDYNLKELTEVWTATTAEDAHLVGITHCGTQDPAFDPGPYSEFMETYLEKFAKWYDTRLKVHGV